MQKLFILTGMVLFAGLSHAQNAAPVVSNVNFTPGVGTVVITYDVADAENENVEVTLRASADGGKSFNIIPRLVTGDVGPNIAPGTAKQITWTAGIEQPTADLSTLVYRVIADDGEKPDIKKIIAQIDSKEILNRFFNVYGNNHPNSQAHYDQTRNYIYNYYNTLGYRASRDTFTFPERNGVNIIGLKQGIMQEDSSVLLSGHYDTVEPTMGADDNNMSVAIMLEAARILKDYQFKHSIVFANWDLEEVALVGAYYYAASAKSVGLKSVLNFDGISIYKEEPNSQQVPTGFDLLFPDAYAKAAADSFRGNFITLIADAKSAALNQKAVQFADRYTPSLRFIDITCPDPSCAVARDLRRSDHAPFWDRGIPSVFFTSTTEFRSDCYHLPCDTTYNVNFSTKVLKLATAMLIDEAQPMHVGFAQTQNASSVKAISKENGWYVATPYPNPINIHAFFNIGLGEEDKVTVEIFDVQGKKVAEAYNGTMSAGAHTIAWDVNESYPSGVYHAKISTAKGMNKSYPLMIMPRNDYSHGH